MAGDTGRENLFRMAGNGDIEAFEKLIEGFDKKVYCIMLKFAGNREEAMDLTQTVFIRVFKTMKSLENEKLLPLHIYRTVRDICFDITGEKRETGAVVAGRAGQRVD